MAFIRRINSKNPADLQLDKQQLTFGRDKENDVCVDKYGGISRNHCGFTVYEDGVVTLTDFGSRNGTFVNQEKIFEETRLKHRDEIIICEELKFVYLDFESEAGKKERADEIAREKDEEARKQKAIVVEGDEKMSDAMSELNNELADGDKDFKSMMDDILKSTRKKGSAPPPKKLDNSPADPEKWVNTYEDIKIKRQ